MKQEQVADLISVLDDEYEFYRQLNDFAVRKKDAIIENEVEELTEIIEEEQVIIEKINKKEDKRDQLLRKLVEEEGLDAEAPDFEELLSAVKKEEQQDRLQEIREKLLQVIDDLHQKNEDNKILLEEAIKFNNFSYNMIAQILEPHANTYNPEGDSDDSTSHILDHRA